MNKSRNPEHYIERSKMAIKKFSEENIPFLPALFWAIGEKTRIQ